ncbi:hypothetical protein CRM22_005918 [Opisthorchis felineus]|uniref:G-protein coupled receptors family 1 profile domain-containing protein n=1 Tax=Opisthorchis felineus TaxID=147828 RepID=A0A4S2LW70_OPIFE|nr:hypothetical protein CRM22_005918 [Opisthorchis felineus]
MMNVSVVIDQPIFQTRLGWTHFWLTLVILGTLILCTIVGNVFVVAAILLEKHLQGVSNYLILSLAVADLMVATLPMPISAVSEVSLDWWLGESVCDFWICSDVLCCTASILHLVGIALDRYWAVTNAEYFRRRTAQRIGIMIAAFWFLSLVISLPARFDYARITNWINGVSTNMTEVCSINKEYGYTIFSTVGAFYVPMLFMIGIYARIYTVARSRIRKSAFRKPYCVSKLASSPHVPKILVESNNAERPSSIDRLLKCCHICYKKPPVSNYLEPGCGHTEHTYLTNQLSATVSSHAYHSSSSTELNRMNGWRTNSAKDVIKSLDDLTNVVTPPDQKSTDPFDCDEKQIKPIVTTQEMPPIGSSVPKSTVDSNPEEPLFTDRSLSIYHKHYWNGVCHSAPASCYNIKSLDSPTMYSTNSGDDSSESRTDRSDDPGDWSSSSSEIQKHSKYSSITLDWYNTKYKGAFCQLFRSLLKRNTCNRQKMTRWKLTRRGLSENAAEFWQASPNFREKYGDAKQTVKESKGATSSLVRASAASLLQAGQCLPSPLILAADEHNQMHHQKSADETTPVCTQTELSATAAALRRERIENKRERKAVMTLAIITGCFMLCWLPFFINALVSPFYEKWQPSRATGDIILWLGYSNSLLNPVIYTIFSPDFREAFRKILFGRYYRWSRER